MSYTTTEFQEFLATVAPFNQLPADVLAGLAEKCQPWRYKMGQVILMRGKLSNHFMILLTGQARLLGYDPRNQLPITLQLLKPGSLLGWVNLVRGVACETAIASTESICLTLSSSEFQELQSKYSAFQEAFGEQCALIELFELLGSQLAQQAQGEANLKQLTTEILEKATVYSLPPGVSFLPEHPPLQNPETLWFVSGGGEVENFPVGSYFPEEIDRIKVTGEKPARLVGIPLELWEKSTEFTEETIPTVKPEVVIDTPQGIVSIPLADDSLMGVALKPASPRIEGKTKKVYPFFAGKTTLEAGLACFQMLSQHFGMPFRKDIIRRILSDQLQNTDSFSLPLCGAITELMGLNAQLITIPFSAFTQLHAPVLVRWQNHLAIVYEISEKNLVLAIPEMGLIHRKPEEFLKTWQPEGEGEEGAAQKGGQVLLLQTTKETPQERFGLRWFIPAIKRHRRVLIEVFIASFFVQIFGLANPLMIQVIIDKVIVQNSVDTLQVLGIGLLVLAVFEAVLTTLRTYLFVDTTNRIDMTLGSEIIDHLLRLPLRYFERRPVGEISTRVNELENIRSFLTGTALTVVLDAVFSVVYIIVMIWYSVLLTLVALGIIPIFVVLTLIFSPTIRRQLRVKAERNAETQSYLVEVMSGIQTVKAQNIELRSRWQWQERYARYVTAGFQTVITSTLAGSMSNFLNKLSGLLVLWVGAYLVLLPTDDPNHLTLGALIAFRIIAGYVTSPILRLTQLWQNFQETALSLERLADIVDTPQEAERDRQNIPMPFIKGAVRYENVSFRFKQHGPLQLNNVNLEVAPGTFVGVVGQSGAGKSTLTKLISRLYEPESGQILIDGYDIGKVELYSLRRQVGVVPQDPLLFEGTIQENIAITNPDATIEEIIDAAQAAAAHEFIMGLPNGYNTRVGERGASLSGGQRQRIAIARSVLQNPRILVLDEATSALDYTTEQQVCINLIKFFRDRTVFFITHRLGSVKTANVIILMDSGSIVEQGTHEELMALKGRYYYLYQQQERN